MKHLEISLVVTRHEIATIILVFETTLKMYVAGV